MSRVQDELVAKIKKCKPLLAKIKGFGEINVDFLATEATAFSFDEPTFFHRIYSQNGSQRSPRPNQLGFSAPLSPVHVEIVDRLVSVCATLNEYPHIRYKADDIKSQRTGICPKIALLFKDRLDQFVASNPEWWYHGGPGHSERDRGVLLIVERAEDPLSPLVHEFTYRAMVHDLLEMAGEKYTYTPTTQKNASEREVLLNDNDECWVEFRDNHIAEVTEMLSGRTKEYLSNNSGAALARNAGKNMSLGQMSEALKQLPEYREIISKLSQHIHISSQCMDEFKKQNLKGIAEVEQTMVTGERENGNKVKKDVLLKELLAELRKVDQLMALRLISIYIVSQGGILAKDKEELFRVAGLSKTQRNAVANFELLGVKLERQEKKKLERLFSSRVIAKGRNDMNSEYAISRYKCYLKEVMEELVNNTLSFEKYPSILPMPVGGSSGAAASARSARTRHANHSTGPIRRSANTKMFSGGRQIVFVAGGACYSELRSVQEVMETCDKEIILGSTHFITPTSFLEDMERLSDM
uniref:Uncharacterized protein n=1 Tax=Corethron hystrix TaxID=216773 RepID=A0A7S1BZN1_9STRA